MKIYGLYLIGQVAIFYWMKVQFITLVEIFDTLLDPWNSTVGIIDKSGLESG